MIRVGRKERKRAPTKYTTAHTDNMNYELMLAVTILAAMGAGFAWLSHQMKDVRDELKADIKRVEEKLDNKK